VTESGTPAISALGVGKKYVKYTDTPTLIGALQFLSRSKREPLWALRGLDLVVQRGESAGIIGRNGSGKSTLLRMLAGVTAPTEGTISVRGRVAPLISVGVGFHPELTGRENVYLTGTILGLERRVIDERFDEIVEFSEIEGFIDTPVKFYSSGMYVRLGFAVSVVSEPDVFLVDEVLAVGDLAFQLKCFDRMQEIRQRGTTVVVVSHNLNAIRRLCDRTAVIHDGALAFDGPTPDAISKFHQLLGEMREIETDDVLFSKEQEGGGAAFEHFRLVDADGQTAAHFTAEDELRFEADVRVTALPDDAYVALRLFHASGVSIYREAFPLNGSGGLAPGRHRVVLTMPVDLPRGSYSADVSIADPSGTIHAPAAPTVLFYVDGRKRVTGVADLHARLSVVNR
jgi:ABC-type polysaccharide/polyol phosphate transport system ATPase subunit